MNVKWGELGDFLLRLISILRSKFYNRLTWAIAIAGLAMMSTTLVERLIVVFLEKTIDLKITGQNDVAWGFALVIAALVYHLATTSMFELLKTQDSARKEEKKEEQKSEHDRDVFVRASQVLSTEQLENFLSWLENDHSYRRDEISKIEEFGRFLANDDNTFLSSGLDDLTQSYLRSILALLNFTAYKFDIFPPQQTGGNLRFCMMPDLNIDRGGSPKLEKMKKYDELSSELDGLVADLREKHREWRGGIKSNLVI